ncbi:hypothetical protein [Variovorax sp. LT1R16]|uniref:hypothetical protein n=1 Tax=Variovorax sp. LT1R16 TaxID=3443728 RepID=UPI003F46C207
MNRLFLRRSLRLALVFLFSFPVLSLAHEGHDHEEAPAPATATVPDADATPGRFAATSAGFELVGVLSGKLLTLYLDHAVDNRPVEGATLEVAVDGRTLPATAHGAGEFEVALDAEPEHGPLPVRVKVVTSAASAHLEGTLEAEAHTHAEEAHGGRNTKTLLLWGAGGAVVLALLVFGTRRALRSGAAA